MTHRSPRHRSVARRLAGVVLLAALACLPFTASAQATADLVEGRDYVAIPDGKPWQPLKKGQSEVTELFAYWCGHCANFQPMVNEWKRTLPKSIRFGYVPAAFDPQDAYARAFYVAEATGLLSKTHDAVFKAVHVDQSLPRRNPSEDEIIAFYVGLGGNAAKLRAAYAAPALTERMAAARAFAERSGIEGTPTLVVNGRWRVMGTSLGDSLRIARALAERDAAR